MKSTFKKLLITSLLSAVLWQATPAHAIILAGGPLPSPQQYKTYITRIAKECKKAWDEAPEEQKTILLLKMNSWASFFIPSLHPVCKIQEIMLKERHATQEEKKICIDKNGNFCNGYKPRRQPQQQPKKQSGKKQDKQQPAKKSRGK